MIESKYDVDGRKVVVTQAVERTILLEMLAKRISVKWAASEVFSRARFVECGDHVSVRLWGRCIATEEMRETMHQEWMLQLDDDFVEVRRRADAEYRQDMQPGRI